MGYSLLYIILPYLSLLPTFILDVDAEEFMFFFYFTISCPLKGGPEPPAND